MMAVCNLVDYSDSDDDIEILDNFPNGNDKIDNRDNVHMAGNSSNHGSLANHERNGNVNGNGNGNGHVNGNGNSNGNGDFRGNQENGNNCGNANNSRNREIEFPNERRFGSMNYDGNNYSNLHSNIPSQSHEPTLYNSANGIGIDFQNGNGNRHIVPHSHSQSQSQSQSLSHSQGHRRHGSQPMMSVGYEGVGHGDSGVSQFDSHGESSQFEFQSQSHSKAKQGSKKKGRRASISVPSNPRWNAVNGFDLNAFGGNGNGIANGNNGITHGNGRQEWLAPPLQFRLGYFTGDEATDGNNDDSVESDYDDKIPPVPGRTLNPRQTKVKQIHDTKNIKFTSLTNTGAAVPGPMSTRETRQAHVASKSKTQDVSGVCRIIKKEEKEEENDKEKEKENENAKDYGNGNGNGNDATNSQEAHSKSKHHCKCQFQDTQLQSSKNYSNWNNCDGHRMYGSVLNHNSDQISFEELQQINWESARQMQRMRHACGMNSNGINCNANGNMFANCNGQGTASYGCHGMSHGSHGYMNMNANMNSNANANANRFSNGNGMNANGNGNGNGNGYNQSQSHLYSNTNGYPNCNSHSNDGWNNGLGGTKEFE